MSARETGRLADFLATNLHLETAKALAKLLSKRRWPKPKQPVLSIDEYLDQQKPAKGDVKKEPPPRRPGRHGRRSPSRRPRPGKSGGAIFRAGRKVHGGPS
jgi:hypothetical protein